MDRDGVGFELRDLDAKILCKVPSTPDVSGPWNFQARRILPFRDFGGVQLYINSSFSDGSVVKNPLAMQETQETQVRSLGGEDPLEKEMATHTSILVWRIPWTTQSMGSQRVRHN